MTEKLIRENPFVSNEAIATHIGMDSGGVSRLLSGMRDKQHIGRYVNSAAQGFNVQAFIVLRVDLNRLESGTRFGYSNEAEFSDFLRNGILALPAFADVQNEIVIERVCDVSGPKADLLMFVCGKGDTPQMFVKILRSLKLPGVVATNTYHYLPPIAKRDNYN